MNTMIMPTTISTTHFAFFQIPLNIRKIRNVEIPTEIIMMIATGSGIGDPASNPFTTN